MLRTREFLLNIGLGIPTEKISYSYFFVISSLLAFLIFSRYQGSLALPQLNWIDSVKPVYMYLFYMLPFLLAYLLQFFFYENNSFFKEKRFWIVVLAAPLIFTLRIFAGRQFGADLIQVINRQWFAFVIMALKTSLLVLPAMMLWWMYFKSRNYSLGFQKIKKVWPYFMLLLLMVPLALLASRHQSFDRHYPYITLSSQSSIDYGLPQLLVGEFLYAADLIGIEFFFRGFLVIALVRFCGSRAIIPAACFYCCIHFGKPMVEAISSFFGGLILGCISFNTKSIKGGVIIHIGIAWLMDALAFLNK